MEYIFESYLEVDNEIEARVGVLVNNVIVFIGEYFLARVTGWCKNVLVCRIVGECRSV